MFDAKPSQPDVKIDLIAQRHPDEIEKEPSTLTPKSDEPTVLIPIERQIQNAPTNSTSSAEGLTVTIWTTGFKPNAR